MSGGLGKIVNGGHDKTVRVINSGQGLTKTVSITVWMGEEHLSSKSYLWFYCHWFLKFITPVNGPTYMYIWVALIELCVL